MNRIFPPTRVTHFPYTTLFRSARVGGDELLGADADRARRTRLPCRALRADGPDRGRELPVPVEGRSLFGAGVREAWMVFTAPAFWAKSAVFAFPARLALVAWTAA